MTNLSTIERELKLFIGQKFNPHHSESTGQFAPGGGGSGTEGATVDRILNGTTGNFGESLVDVDTSGATTRLDARNEIGTEHSTFEKRADGWYHVSTYTSESTTDVGTTKAINKKLDPKVGAQFDSIVAAHGTAKAANVQRRKDPTERAADRFIHSQTDARAIRFGANRIADGTAKGGPDVAQAKLLMTGAKTGPVHKDLYRGIEFREGQVPFGEGVVKGGTLHYKSPQQLTAGEFKVGSVHSIPLTSTSRDVGVARSFAGHPRPNTSTSVMIHFKNTRGLPIGEHDEDYKWVKETLISGNFRVAKSTIDGATLHVEMEPVG